MQLEIVKVQLQKYLVWSSESERRGRGTGAWVAERKRRTAGMRTCDQSLSVAAPAVAAPGDSGCTSRAPRGAVAGGTDTGLASVYSQPNVYAPHRTNDQPRTTLTLCVRA